MADSDEYLVLKEACTGEYSERGSKFLAHAYPVRSEEEANAYLHELRKKHPKARHVVYAFRLDPESGIHRYSDDGEPANSSGLPTYHALLSAGLYQTAVFTVRYFGGTKLGVPGLVHAYRTAAEDALRKGSLETRRPMEELEFRIPYADQHFAFLTIKKFPAETLEQRMEADVYFRLLVPKKDVEELKTLLSQHQNVIFVR